MIFLFLMFSALAEVQSFEAKTVYCFDSKKLISRSSLPESFQMTWVLQKKDGFLYEYVQTPECHFFNNVTFNSYFPAINSTLLIRGCSKNVNIPELGDISMSPKLKDFEDINNQTIAKKMGKNCYVLFYETVGINHYRFSKAKRSLIPKHVLPMALEDL